MTSSTSFPKPPERWLSFHKEEMLPAPSGYNPPRCMIETHTPPLPVSQAAIGDDLERQLSKAVKTLSKLPQKRAAAEAAGEASLVEQCDTYSRDLTAERDRLQGQVRETDHMKRRHPLPGSRAARRLELGLVARHVQPRADGREGSAAGAGAQEILDPLPDLRAATPTG
jgi:hypothetical protein